MMVYSLKVNNMIMVYKDGKIQNKCMEVDGFKVDTMAKVNGLMPQEILD